MLYFVQDFRCLEFLISVGVREVLREDLKKR